MNQIRRTPILMSQYEVDTIKRHSFDRGFVTGVIVTAAWSIYNQYRVQRRYYNRIKAEEESRRI